MGGMHHICIEVVDVSAAIAALKAKGATVLHAIHPNIQIVTACSATSRALAVSTQPNGL